MADADETASHAELTDEQLDVLLEATDRELLEHVRARADSNSFVTIMAETTHVAGHEAARVIGARSDVAVVYRSLGQARDLLNLRAGGLGDARDLVGVRAFVGGLAPVADVVCAIDVALDLDADIVGGAIADLAHDLDDHLGFLRDLVRNLDRADLALERALVRALVHALDRAVELARAVAGDLARDLDRLRVEASGADLSGMRIADLRVLNGVIWTDRTTWPPDIEGRVRSRSAQLRPGIYQVRGGNPPPAAGT